MNIFIEFISKNMICVVQSKRWKLLHVLYFIVNAMEALILTHIFRFISVKFYFGEPFTRNIFRGPFKLG